MATKAERIRRQSTEGARVGWTLQRLIVKSNDDVRQEVFVMQVETTLGKSPCDGYFLIVPSQKKWLWSSRALKRV